MSEKEKKFAAEAGTRLSDQEAEELKKKFPEIEIGEEEIIIPTHFKDGSTVRVNLMRWRDGHLEEKINAIIEEYPKVNSGAELNLEKAAAKRAAEKKNKNAA